MMGRAVRQVRQNLVSYLALFFAVSGSAMAARPLITGDDIEDDSITGKQVNESTLGTVPSAVNATNAQYAVSADNALNLGNQPPSAFAPSTVESLHVIGAPGEPAFLNGWHAGPAGGYMTTPAFYKDPWGVVHFQGAIACGESTAGEIFILPDGYRPAVVQTFIVSSLTYQTVGQVFVYPAGDVRMGTDDCRVALDGITFRAGS